MNFLLFPCQFFERPFFGRGETVPSFRSTLREGLVVVLWYVYTLSF
jgi:hypothetical protein